MLNNIKCVLIAIFLAFSLGASADESKYLETPPKDNMTRNQPSSLVSDVETVETDRGAQRYSCRDLMSGAASLVFVFAIAMITAPKQLK